MVKKIAKALMPNKKEKSVLIFSVIRSWAAFSSFISTFEDTQKKFVFLSFLIFSYGILLMMEDIYNEN